MCEFPFNGLCLMFLAIMILSVSYQAVGADVPLAWDKVDRASGYYIEARVDGGVTWGGSKRLATVALTWTGAGTPTLLRPRTP